MKTNQELLDFYGVEIGKKYKVTKSVSFVKVGTIFTINNECKIFHGEPNPLPLFALDYLDYEEIESPILDDKEREYLQKYVMDNPAFKGKVHSIWKCITGKYENLRILTKNSNDFAIYLPRFIKNSMYKNIRPFVSYTPQDLGLEE